MIDHNRTGMCTCVGPLAPHIDGFVSFLVREGYSACSVKEKRDLIIDLSRWMERHKIPLHKLDEKQLRNFESIVDLGLVYSGAKICALPANYFIFARSRLRF
jgi:hypothetical protein